MPICPAYVSGKCRGQCPNLHVDIKQAIATTIKASLTGKQWLLSNFAPFEGDSDLPNYIDDLSFEEARSDFYAARATGTEHLAKQRFQQLWSQAQEMSMKMVNPDHNVQKYLVDTFGLDGQKNKAKTGSLLAPPNPFGQVPTNSQPSAAGSIFGGGTTNATALGGGSIFGGGTATNTAATGGSIFGGSTTPAATGGSIFGGGAAAVMPQAGGSIFGGGNAAQTGGSIFGGQAQPSPGGNIFGQASQPAQTNIFGQAQLSQPQATGSIFAQANQSLPAAAPGNVFAQSPFGGGGITAQPQPPAQQGNIFQQAATPSPFAQQQPPSQSAPGNVFGNASQQPPTSIFGQPAQNQQQPVNLASNSNVFAGSPFGGGATASVPTTSVPSTVSANADSKLYSEPGELPAHILQVFRSTAPFELGKIPNAPPPRECC